MMEKNETNVNNFKGYSVSYIQDLLNIVSEDVQDNTPISEDDYMTVALDACKKFNEDFTESNFDVEI